MNTPGAELFTSYLGNYMNSAYHVPSHAKEKKYQEVWNAKVLRYHLDREIAEAGKFEGD